MIPIIPIHVCSVYIIFWLLLLIILWIYGEWKHRSRYDWSIVKERLYYCDHCHISFLASNEKQNSARCPACGDLCFNRKKRKF